MGPGALGSSHGLRVGRSPFERSLDRWARWLLAVYWPSLFVATHWPGLTLPEGSPVLQTDKLVHVVVFGVLAWLALRSHLLTRWLGEHGGALATTAVVLVYAVVDEYTQQFVNRYTGVEDAVANAIGVLGAYLVSRPRHTIACRDALAVVMRWVLVVLTPGLVVLFLRPEANEYLIRLASWVGLGRHGADKPGHLYVALLWTAMLAMAMPAGLRRPRWGVLVTVVVMSGSAPLIEWSQRGTGRGVEVADVYWHQLGVLTALVLWVLLSGARPVLRRVGIGERVHER
ncbi:VanZ family protein [Mucisphaera sp.]|uniref:VanZ family protein n=1 Tax=Mucisphaera sp. TaxID=2913024 RepID=UPI003D12D753